LKLCLRAIADAAADAGISTRDIDGFVSYGSERNDPQRMMSALGTRELRFHALMWAHGGGIPGALGLAATAIATGQADAVVVYRSMAESAGGRLRVAVAQDDTAAQYLVNGLDAPAQMCAMRTQRLLEGEGVPRSSMKAMVQAAYFHARNNPGAVGRATTVTDETYEASRWISEPYHLFDCSRENDAAVAVLMVAADRSKDLCERPAYVLAAPSGAQVGWGSLEENHHPYWSAGFQGVARRLWSESGYGPADVGVAQVYENMSGMGVSAIIDHGFCSLAEAGDFFTVDNLTAPGGLLPVNTAGGNLAEGFIHGMGLVSEAVRQIRGTSCNQVPGAGLSLVTGGPGDSSVSSLLLGSDATL
jgi:acetyl-CoA acetyltransferase